MESKITKYQIEVKELKKKGGKSMIEIPSETFVTEEDCDHYVLKLTDIKSQLESDMKIYEEEKV